MTMRKLMMVTPWIEPSGIASGWNAKGNTGERLIHSTNTPLLQVWYLMPCWVFRIQTWIRWPFTSSNSVLHRRKYGYVCYSRCMYWALCCGHRKRGSHLSVWSGKALWTSLCESTPFGKMPRAGGLFSNCNLMEWSVHNQGKIGMNLWGHSGLAAKVNFFKVVVVHKLAVVSWDLLPFFFYFMFSVEVSELDLSWFSTYFVQC